MVVIPDNWQEMLQVRSIPLSSKIDFKEILVLLLWNDHRQIYGYYKPITANDIVSDIIAAMESDLREESKNALVSSPIPKEKRKKFNSSVKTEALDQNWKRRLYDDLIPIEQYIELANAT